MSRMFFFDINATLGLTPDPQPAPAEPPETILQVGGALAGCLEGAAWLLHDCNAGGEVLGLAGHKQVHVQHM
jgi:hypothetical protein